VGPSRLESPTWHGQQPIRIAPQPDDATTARLGRTAAWAACFGTILSLRKTAALYRMTPRARVLPGRKLRRVEPHTPTRGYVIGSYGSRCLFFEEEYPRMARRLSRRVGLFPGRKRVLS
jgi:hypothetical protein